MAKFLLLAGAILVLTSGILLTWLWPQYGSVWTDQPLQPGEVRNQNSLSPSPSSTTSATTNESVAYEMEVVAEDLQVPWDLTFTSESRILVTERTGSIKVIQDNLLLENPLITIDDVSPNAEAGLMGMTLDPNYQTNKLFYVCYAYDSNRGLRDRIVQLKDSGTQAEIITTIIEDIPAARFHAGCRLETGPDEKLYVTTGDATNPDSAQNTNSLAGKILRLNWDGSIPSDNPLGDSAIYSYGHRNPQGIAWHPQTGQLVATEHGPSGNDGPPGGDEVNLILPGENYGWPEVSHQESQPEFVDPLLVFTPAEAPASGMFYSGNVFPQLKNKYFFGALKGEGIIQIEFDQPITQVISYQKLDIQVGRIRDVAQSPDGLIYFTTSNTDGRGNMFDGDDKVYRFIPTN